MTGARVWPFLVRTALDRRITHYDQMDVWYIVLLSNCVAFSNLFAFLLFFIILPSPLMPLTLETLVLSFVLDLLD